MCMYGNKWECSVMPVGRVDYPSPGTASLS